MDNSRREHPKFLLTWAFEYLDHKPDKFGMWSMPGIHKTEMAWCQNKENLLKASIKGKNFLTKEIITLASCPGHDFVNFQWIAGATKMGIELRGTKKLPMKVIGLMLVTRTHKIKIFDNGNLETLKHDIDYGNVHLAGFGR